MSLKKLLPVLLIVNLILYSYLFTSLGASETFFTKEAKFGEIDLRGKTLSEGSEILYSKLNEPIYLSLKSTSQATSLKELGVSIDEGVLEEFTKTCPLKYIRFFCEGEFRKKPNIEDAIEFDSQIMEAYLEGLESSLRFLTQNNIISFEDYSFRALSPQAKITIDRKKLNSKSKILEYFTQGPIKISLGIDTWDETERQEGVTTAFIPKITHPMLIKYGRNKLWIPKETVEKFVTTDVKEGFVHGFISAEEVEKYLSELQEIYETEQVQILKKEAVEAIQRAMLFRAANYEINNAVILPLEGKPVSDGSLHEEYLEIVKSQQRLYRFEKGKLVKTYIISTGLTWETPAGNHRVLGKQKMTISYFGAWYMPNYLPVGRINGYLFGLHAIPYHMDGAGNIYSRNPNTMGSPATGGCIQLTDEDSLELFDWAKIGMPVYIYE
ncbi:L,D-transpeptidase [Patescibacteria group bacterium]